VAHSHRSYFDPGRLSLTAPNNPAAPILVVAATPQHVEQIAPLFDAYRQFYQQPADLPQARDFLTRRLSRGESVIFLALAGAADEALAVGFTQLYPMFSSIAMRPAWLLNDLYVAPRARSRGVGAALLTRARAFAVGTGASEMMLQTAVTNQVAQRLYTGLGWIRDDEYLTFMLPL
jgi:ribosomal protein S18 acetylase RimI-like enzyme